MIQRHRTRIVRKAVFIGPSLFRRMSITGSRVGRIKVTTDAEGEAAPGTSDRRNDAPTPGIVADDQPGYQVAYERAGRHVGGPMAVQGHSRQPHSDGDGVSDDRNPAGPAMWSAPSATDGRCRPVMLLRKLSRMKLWRKALAAK